MDIALLPIARPDARNGRFGAVDNSDDMVYIHRFENLDLGGVDYDSISIVVALCDLSELVRL